MAEVETVVVVKDSAKVTVNKEDADNWLSKGWELDTAKAPSLSKMKKEDLLALAAEKGIEVPDDAKKDDIVALLEGGE